MELGPVRALLLRNLAFWEREARDEAEGRGMKKIIVVAALVFSSLLTAPARAQSPSPIAADRVYTETREFRIDAVALGVGWTLDTISTHDWVKGNPRFVEVGGLCNGSRSTPKIMGAWAAVDVGAALVSYEWKRHVHNRWLHPLWRVPLCYYLDTEGSVL